MKNALIPLLFGLLIFGLGGCHKTLTPEQLQDKQKWSQWRAGNDLAARDPNASFLNIRDAKYLQPSESVWLDSQASPEQIRWQDRVAGMDFGLTHGGEQADIAWFHAEHTLKPGEEIALNDRLIVSVGSLYQGGMRAFIRDTQHPKLAQFEGYQFFPYNPKAKVEASYTATAVTPVLFQTVQGLTNRFFRIGLLNFDWQGEQITVPVYHGDDQAPFDSLFLFFKDQTNGDTTYGGGREIYLELEQDLAQPLDKPLVIDFNYTINFYCARSTFWNCPVIRDNPLNIAIDAGETYQQKS